MPFENGVTFLLHVLFLEWLWDAGGNNPCYRIRKVKFKTIFSLCYSFSSSDENAF